MRRLAAWIPGFLLAFGWEWAADPQTAQGQIKIQVQGGRGRVVVTDGENESADDRARVHPPTDRVLSRGMRQAEEAVSRGEFVEALRFLDDVLGRHEDYFVETNAEGGFAGLKETARGLIRDLPDDGRRAYEAVYGPVAERLLRSAIAAGDAAQLEAVAQRYFYTPAGFQAALLLAADEADAGRHLAAALWRQQLLDTAAAVRLYDPALSIHAAASWLAADDAAQARRVLEALAERGRGAVEIGGREYSLDAEALGDPLAWLRENVGEPADVAAAPQQQWLTYRGNAARNAEADGGLPHMRVRWKVGLLVPYPKLEELFEEYNAELVQAGRATPVASAALAAGDYILVRTPLGLLAVDFRTGKRIWRSEIQRDQQLEQLVRSGGKGDDMANAEPARAFVRRMWEDYLYGVVASDGDRVYVIRDLPMPVDQDYEMAPFMSITGGEATAPSNRLSAYELASEGRLVWELDGAVAKGDLAGAFFLGAPLAMGSSLYVLMEIRDDVYLAALDAATGELQWRQQLANLETGVLLDLRRRLQAASPSYDSGMLVCPTGAGVVVGVDLSKRSLAWAYRYETVSPFAGMYGPAAGEPHEALANRWTDGAAMIADGRVLVTPPESNELHCLDLRAGRVLWKRPRGEMQRLACVHGDTILLVGSLKLQALRLADGEPAWDDDELELPRGASPAGNGFVSDGKYYLPLTTGEVVAIDLAAGRIVARVQARDGVPLGNLICHRGTVISQNGMSLDCFDQVDALRTRSQRRLGEDPNDVDALRSLGEIAYNEGRLSEAIELAERAYRQASDDLETRDMLAECLAAALDEDFAAYRARLPLLKELGGGGAIGRLQVLRIEAKGLLETGDPRGSAAVCFEMYRSASSPDEPLPVGREHETIVSRWVQAQMTAIWDATAVADRANLGEQVRAEAPPADAPGDRLERSLKFFGALPELDDLKLQRARQFDAEKRTFESQQLCLDLVEAADPVIRREAVARIAAGLHAGGLHSLAVDYDRTLGDEFADAVCLEGATGRELLDSWASEVASAAVEWPTGRVDVRNAPTSGGAAAIRTRAPAWGIRLEHSDSILARGVGYLAARGGIAWHDGLGREVFAATLDAESQSTYRQSAGNLFGASRGNLLIVSLGRELAAFNTLPTPDGQSAPLVWRVSLGSNFNYQDSYLDEMSRHAPRRPGSFRAPRTTIDGKWAGVIGPISSGGCVYQDQRRLVCVDPVTGEALWSRTDVPPGCDLFGDGRYVFATPAGAETALVYSAIDGRSLGKARVGAWEERLTTRGRLVVRWIENDDGAKELAAFDPLTQDIAWRHTFEADAHVDLDMNRYAAVVEPRGRAAIIDLATGKSVLAQSIPRQPAVEQIHLSASDRSFTLVVERPTAGNTDRQVHPLGGLDAPVVDGQAFVFDRAAGKMLWSRPAELLQQALLLDQPADLPFIAFAGVLSSRSRGDGRDATTMLLLDKATGRTLFSSDELPQAGVAYSLMRVSDATRHEVTVEMAGRSIVLQFTDARRPPEPPALAEVESASGKVSRGLMGILRTLGGAN